MFQGRTLLSLSNAVQTFYSLKMAPDDRMIPYINRVHYPRTDLKAMNAIAFDQELAMKSLCGLSSQFEHLIVAIDAAADDEKLTIKFLKSRLIQGEQQILDRSSRAGKHSHVALVGQSDGCTNTRLVPFCFHCNCRGHFEQKCWQMYHPRELGHKSFLIESSYHYEPQKT